jgi:hypothetical protein
VIVSRLVAGTALLTIGFSASQSRAAESGKSAPIAGETQKDGVRWRAEWGHVGAVDYAIAGVGLGGTLAIEFAFDTT